jgi:ubiquinone/menaquinone biosynthesis C-methylase UbiE
MFRNFIAGQFKKPTGFFGNFSSRVMVKGNSHRYNTLIKDLDIQPEDKILEIGYGPGIGIQMITRLCPTCTVHGIDFSKLMFKKAAKLNKSAIDQSKVQLLLGDYLKLPTDQNRYDKIFCLNVIYFWDELSKPLQKTHVLLKTGGLFHIFMASASFLNEKKAPDTVFNKYSIEQVVDALNAVGFTQVEHYFNKGYYIKAKK